MYRTLEYLYTKNKFIQILYNIYFYTTRSLSLADQEIGEVENGVVLRLKKIFYSIKVII